MDWETLGEIWRRHRGKIIGLGGGLVFALLTVTVGFWKAIFILICLGFGYWLGKKVDEGGGWQHWREKIFRE